MTLTVDDVAQNKVSQILSQILECQTQGFDVEWVTYELSGYPNNITIPEYRTIMCGLKVMLKDRNDQISNYEITDKKFEFCVTHGVDELEEIANIDNNSNLFSIPFETKFAKQIIRKAKQVKSSVVEIIAVPDQDYANQILDILRSRILTTVKNNEDEQKALALLDDLPSDTSIHLSQNNARLNDIEVSELHVDMTKGFNELGQEIVKVCDDINLVREMAANKLDKQNTQIVQNHKQSQKNLTKIIQQNAAHENQIKALTELKDRIRVLETQNHHIMTNLQNDAKQKLWRKHPLVIVLSVCLMSLVVIGNISSAVDIPILSQLSNSINISSK